MPSLQNGTLLRGEKATPPPEALATSVFVILGANGETDGLKFLESWWDAASTGKGSKLNPESEPEALNRLIDQARGKFKPCQLDLAPDVCRGSGDQYNSNVRVVPRPRCVGQRLVYAKE